MNLADAALLAALPGWAFAFMLVLCRISAAVMLLPGLGEAELPATMRVVVALGVTVLLLPGLAPLVPRPPDEVWRGVAMIGAELLTGLWLGWLARLLALALPMAGQILSFMIGTSNVLQTDPATGAQTAAISRLFGMLAPLLLLVSGLYALPLSALAGSYRLIPPGALLSPADITETVVQGVGHSFALALRLASPFVLASVVWQVSLGLLARLVPSLQIFLVATPGQILGGLLLLGLLAGTLLGAWETAMRAGFADLPGLR